MTDHDRDAILARRALFITTALASLACTVHDAPEQPDPTPQTEPAELAPREVEGEPIASVPPGDGTRPAWSEIVAAIPPLEVPKGLTESETNLLTGLEANMRARYAELETIWTTLPSCAPSQAECTAWAESVRVITDGQTDWGALCGHSPQTTSTYLERERVHVAYLQEVGALLLADLEAAAKARTAADLAAWEQLRSDAMSRPHPCLSCMAPSAEPVLERVAFDADQPVASTASINDGVLERVAQIHAQNRGRKARLIVRGHADPSEPDPDELAKRRAQAVAAALIQLGVKKAELDVRSYGASLPLTLDAAAAERNRRVDFEVVPKGS